MENDIDIIITCVPDEGARPWYGFTFTMGATGNRYTAEMLAFDEPSQYGIDNGRISKLLVTDAHRNVVAAYDRGWDTLPETDETKRIVELLTNGYN